MIGISWQPGVGEEWDDAALDVMGHRVEAETEEELVRRVQEHMRQDHEWSLGTVSSATCVRKTRSPAEGLQVVRSTTGLLPDGSECGGTGRITARKSAGEHTDGTAL